MILTMTLMTTTTTKKTVLMRVMKTTTPLASSVPPLANVGKDQERLLESGLEMKRRKRRTCVITLVSRYLCLIDFGRRNVSLRKSGSVISNGSPNTILPGPVMVKVWLSQYTSLPQNSNESTMTYFGMCLRLPTELKR